MSFSVKLHPQAAEFIEKAPSALQRRIRNKLESIRNEPFHFLEHFSGQDVYKLRIGKYRALVDVDHKRQVLLIQYIDHRKRIYKRWK